MNDPLPNIVPSQGKPPVVIGYAGPQTTLPPVPEPPSERRLFWERVGVAVLLFVVIASSIALMFYVSWSFHSQVGTP